MSRLRCNLVLTRSPIGLVLLAVAVLTAPAGLSASDSRIALTGGQRPGSNLLATVATLDGRDWHLSPTAVDRGDSRRATIVVLVDADRATTAQLLAHALDGWWCRDEHDAIWIGPERARPGVRRLIADTRIASLPDDPGLESRMLTLLEPWLGPGAGLAYHPFQGMWAATLDQDGHTHLTAILSALERATPLIPALVPAANRRPAPALQVAVTASDPLELATGLAAATQASVALDPALAGRERLPVLTLPAGQPDRAIATLAEAGWHAWWSGSGWCLGEAPPRDRRHPGDSLTQAVIPVEQLARDDTELALLAARLERATDGLRWQRPGFAVWPLPEHTSLLVRGDLTTIGLVMHQLNHWDQHGFANPAGSQP